jgi:predicted Zn-dependent peptidase
MELYRYVSDNGIRLVYHRTPGVVAYCGLMINTGSRDENAEEGEHGAAHFIEHMFFKGTSKRKAYHILSYLDDSGGELNAYTTKEETAVYASVLKEDIERAMNIISDITFNSTFPAKEIEKEKDVIIEEINSYLDNPGEMIYDDFEDLVFLGHPLGRNILGTPDSVKSLKSRMLQKFIKKNYFTDEMVFCLVGNIPEKKLLRLFQKYFGNLPARTGRKRSYPDYHYSPSYNIKRLDTFQTHCVIGNVAYKMDNKNRVGLILLNNLLGGQGLNSRLNMSLREKNGLAYNVESSYNPYQDTGIFSIYFGTDTDNLEKSISIAMKELKSLREKPLGYIQMNKAKNQIKGYLARSYESYENLMLTICKSVLTFDRIDSVEEMTSVIDAITPSNILDIANEIFDQNSLSTLIYK